MAMAINVRADGIFGMYLVERMEANEVGIRELSARVGATYEHIRKLIKRAAYPSPNMLNKLARALKGFNREGAAMLIEEDKAEKNLKYFYAITEKNPELAPIDRVWRYLTDQQKEQLVVM